MPVRITAILPAIILLVLARPGLAETVKTIETESGSVQVENIVGGLVHPWGMAFLPDGRALITERPGRLRLLDTDNALSGPLKGVPEVYARGQGGLLDVAIDPDFQQNRYVYLSYAEKGEGGASTALGRGKLLNNSITDFEVIFRQEPKVSGGNHFGSRIVFSNDGYLYLTLGERFKFKPAQDLSSHLGAIIRIKPDGAIPETNPFIEKADARDEIWTYGNRNIQAAAFEPGTDRLWVAEMGPKGGDELNLIKRGANYGWPEVSWGDHYSGLPIRDPPTRPEFEDAVKYWTPAIAPSGMMFYTGDLFPDWRGDMFIGGLVGKALVRVTLSDKTVAHEEQIAMGARIRDVAQGPDGTVYVLTDQTNGNLWRLSPAR